MRTDHVAQWMRNNAILTSSELTASEREAIKSFITEQSDLETLLNSLGMSRSARLSRHRNPLNKLSPTITKLKVPKLRAARAKEFPKEIADVLRSLDCPLLLIELPKSAKIASDTEIVDGLIRQFGRNKYTLGLVLGDYLEGRHDVTQFFAQASDPDRQKENGLPELSSAELKSLSLGFFIGLGRVPNDQIDYLLHELEPADIIDLAETLQGTRLSVRNGRPSGIEELEKRTFLTLSRRIIDEDFLRQSNPDIEFDLHGEFESSWDAWTADKLSDLLARPAYYNGKNRPTAPFTFDEYLQMKDAFSPYRFPQTAAVLVHVAHTWFDHKLVDLTFEVLESLNSQPTTTTPAIVFLEAVMNDESNLSSQRAIRLLESIEQVLQGKSDEIKDRSDLDLVTTYEVRFAASIASVNGLELMASSETSVHVDPIASARYISGGLPSEAFLKMAIEQKEVAPYIALLENLESKHLHKTLDRSDLELIKENFDNVLAKATARGLRNSPGVQATQHFEDAKTLNALYPKLEKAIAPEIGNTSLGLD